jgi:hypothetical protein
MNFSVGCALNSGKMDGKCVGQLIGLLAEKTSWAMTAWPAGLWSGPWALREK